MGPGAAFVDPHVFQSTNDALKRRGQRIAEKYRQHLDDRKIPNSTCIVLASHTPKQAVDEWCKENKVNTVVAGSRGLGAFKRFFLGSFSQFLVNHLECDVLIVKADASPEHDSDAEQSNKAAA